MQIILSFSHVVGSRSCLLNYFENARRLSVFGVEENKFVLRNLISIPSEAERREIETTNVVISVEPI